MGKRFEYIAPNLFQLAWIRLKDFFTGKQTPSEWIGDKKTGRLHQLDHSDCEALQLLSDYILKRVNEIPKSQRADLIDFMFDEVAFSIVTGKPLADESAIENKITDYLK